MNLILGTDSYKLSHYQLYPAGMTSMISYIEAREGGKWKEVVFFGLQGFMKEYLSKPITKANIEEAKIVAAKHGEPFNLEGWNYILSEYKGYLPIMIEAVNEGTIVPVGNVLAQIVNTDPKCAWLVSYLETALLRAIWYPSTVATNAYMCKLVINKYLEETGCTAIADTAAFMLHDFGARGATSHESASIGSAAHQLFFKGTDTIEGMMYLRDYYGADIESYSIPAMDHATVMSWGPSADDEDKAFENALDKYLGPNKIVACVIDSYDINRVVDIFCTKFKDRIVNSGGRVVLRPDCYSDDTQILTHNGWKYFKDLLEEDLVAQVLDDGSYEFVRPIKYIKQKYSGDMVHFYDYFGKIDLLVTPNHRVIYSKNGERMIQYADECKFYHNKDIIRSATAKSSEIRLSDIERLKIAFQADGSYWSKGNGIRFNFQKSRKIARLLGILNALNVQYKIYNLNDGRVEISIKSIAHEMYKDFSWIDISNLNVEWCKEFIEELSYWDSCKRSDTRFKFDTTNKSVIEKVELIALSAGYGCLISVYNDERKDIFNDVYTAHILKNNLLGGQSITKEIVEYNGYVYCVQVPTGKLLIKRNRGQLVCGNSGDPAFHCINIVNKLADAYGYSLNTKGFKVLPPCVRVLFGDGIDIGIIENILRNAKDQWIAAENFVFGMGGGLLQGVTRDTLRFACKANSVVVDGVQTDIAKKTEGKSSKAGALMLLPNPMRTIASKDATQEDLMANLLRPVFYNGMLMQEIKFSRLDV